jgi:hypothetical protein
MASFLHIDCPDLHKNCVQIQLIILSFGLPEGSPLLTAWITGLDGHGAFPLLMISEHICLGLFGHCIVTQDWWDNRKRCFFKIL